MISNGNTSEKTADFCEIEDGTLDTKHEHSVEHIDDDPIFSNEEQRKIIHRIDRRLVATTAAMYAVSLMDRTNLGNAAIAGMNEELGMEGGYRYVCLFSV